MIYRFGPINNEGGERRLNVAVTRARASMTVVSSFSVTDMDPTHLRSEGAQMLCRYLAYAESGGTDLGNVSKDKPDLNPFERDVASEADGGWRSSGRSVRLLRLLDRFRGSAPDDARTDGACDRV